MKTRTLRISCILLIGLIGALSFVSCEKEEPENQNPTAPGLIAPADDVTIDSLSIELSWNASTDADGDAVTYDVYFGTEATPSSIVATSTTATTFLVEDLADQTTYYWMVVAKDGNTGVGTSEIRSLNINAVAGSWLSEEFTHPQLGATVNTYLFNADGTGHVDVDGTFADLSLDITWEAVNSTLTITNPYGVTDYHYSFEDNGATMLFSDPDTPDTVTETYHRIVD